MRATRIGATCAGLLLCACATTGTNSEQNNGGQRSRFGAVPLPARREVRALRERPPTLRAGQEVAAAAAQWRLTGPLPASLEAGAASQAWSTSDPLEQLAQSVAPATVRTSEALRCLARELAQYALRNEGTSSPSVNHYLAAACGLSSPGHAELFAIEAGSATATTETIFTQLRAQLADTLRAALANASEGAGLGLARDGAKVRIVIVKRDELVRFNTVSMGTSSEAVVRGEVVGAQAQDMIVLMVNTADGGVRLCAPEQGIFAPRFGVRCAAPSDGSPQYAEVMHIPQGRLLGRTVGTALVGGSAEGRLSWQHAPHAAITFTDAASTRSALEAVVNERRRAAGRTALVFNAEENNITCPLASYTVGALTGATETTQAELAMLGMMAGWGVDGRIRGSMAGSNALTTRDGNILLTGALDLPSGRVSLLDPEASRGVLCPVVVDSKFIGLSYATWQLVDEARAHDDEIVWTRIDAERQRVGVGRIERWAGATNALVTTIAAIDRRELDPGDAVRTLSQAAVNESGTSVRAMVFSVFAPGGAPLQIPADLLDASLTRAQIASTWYRAPRSPWAVRVVLVITPAPSSSGTV